MLLKKLILQGYKTFAARTEFEFNSGITAIVGPNGSGKSNVADAIQWILGEQRQSRLRIKRTTDLIFAGSSQRPRQGMAEVSVTLDNTTHRLPMDYSEITISRYIDRSGTSEYYVNGARVRGRDVIELWEKGGIARDSYVVIGQGLVDAALSLSPFERRSLIDAAAGINVYREKKNEALVKLEETQRNLVRINDILNEITPRLNRLQIQAQRAKEQALLMRDLQGLLRLYYGFHWHRQWATLQETIHHQEERANLLAQQQAQEQKIEEELAVLSQGQASLRTDLSRWHQKSSMLHAQVEEMDRNLAVMRERRRLLLTQQTELRQEISELEMQLGKQQAEIAALQTELGRLSQEVEKASARWHQACAVWEEKKHERERIVTVMAETRQRMLQVVAEIAEADASLSEWEQRRQAMADEKERLLAAISRFKAESDTIAQDLAQVSGDEEQIHHRLADLQGQRRRLETEIGNCRSRVAQMEKAERDLLQEISLLEKQRSILSKMRRELSGYYSGVRNVMRAAEDGHLSGIHGPVVRLVHILAHLDIAMEVALGSHLQDIVVERWADAEAAIVMLRQTESGRATFLPLDTMRSRPPMPVPTGEGVLGLAFDLVKFESEYKAVFSYLLGRTLVVTDLKTARRLLDKVGSRTQIVTLDGDLVLPAGSVSGGSRRETDSKIALERTWRELPAQFETLENERKEVEEQKKGVEKTLHMLLTRQGSLDEEIGRLESLLQAKIQERVKLERTLERNQEECTRQVQFLQKLTNEIESFRQRINGLGDRRRDAWQRRATLENRQKDLEAQWATIEAAETKEDVATAEASLALVRQRRDSQQKMLDSHSDSLERLQEQLAVKRLRHSESEDVIAHLSERIRKLEEALHLFSPQLEELRKRIESGEEELVKLEKQASAKRDALEQARSRLFELENQTRQQALEKARLEDELGHLEQQIYEELGPVKLPPENGVSPWHAQQLRLGLEAEVSLPSVAVLPKGLDSEIRELKAQLRRLGSVNPNAPAEYQDELKRYTFLADQAADLSKAVQSLRDVIAELDAIMEEKFAQTFEAVAREFSHYFTSLFGGGSASLELADADGLDKVGIEIIARPPGKRLQSLALLSGGERALTATALLFAILKIKPLPFCVLDEVDAMLDEANVERFRDALVQMAEQTQFIVITHNRHTINAADTIYGISMQRDGVSAVFSLHLDDEEAMFPKETG